MSSHLQPPTAGDSTGADVPMGSATSTPANEGGGAGTSQSAPAASTPIPIDAPTHNGLTEPVPQLAPSNTNSNGNGGRGASSGGSSSHGARSPTGAPSHPSLASRLAAQDQLIQLTDVQSGWIHLQSTYLDTAGGARRVRSFGLRNVSATPVDVEVASDLGMQVVFWADDELADPGNEPPEKDSASVSADSASSTSLSASSSPGSPVVNLCIPPGDTATVFLAFQPSTSQPSTPGAGTPDSDGGFTPRVAPTTSASELSPVPGTRLPSAATAMHGTSILSDPGSSVSASTSVSASGTSLSGGVSGSSRDRDAAAPTRRSDLVHRSFSVHGSVVLHATAHTDDVLTAPPHQNVTLPFFASVCRSLFSAAVIDPATGLASGSQISSGELVIDFGTDNVVGTEVHRDILIVNRSEIDLVWNTAVLNCRFKDSVWFSLRDLDSENVFGVDTSAEPVPLPALSSRHLRLALRATSPITDFDFDFVISNMNQSGNVVTCRAVGSCQSTTSGDTLRILSGSALDFGQIPDGTWTKKLLVAKNVGDRPIDVHFSATPGYEVVFRLAGVAGEDIDEDVPARTPAPHKRAEALSRTSTRDGPSRGRDASFGSRYSDSGFGNRLDVVSSSTVTSAQRSQPTLSEAGSAIETEEILSGPASTSDRDSSMPPSRPLSRVTSRSSSYRPSQNDGDSDDDREPMLLTGGTDQQQSQQATERPSDNLGDRDIPNQIEELTMRPGTEYRVFAMYRPARDLSNPPEVAGALRPSSFKVYLDSAPSAQRSRPVSRSRKAVHCTAESCTSIIAIPTGHLIDFGEVTVGASKSTTIAIQNLSALSARVEIAAISKVLNTNRNVIVIPPFETVNERIDFFPRRINDRYEKQVFVRNHLNRTNNQLIEVHSKNVDVYNVTLHSHLYRILTPSGRNFVDFGSVVVNSPSVRTVQFQNLTHKPLTLDLSASQPEDVEMYIKESDAPPVCSTRPFISSKYPPVDESRTDRPANGGMKERFVESLQEKDQGSESKPPAKHKSRDKSVTRRAKDEDKASLGASLVAAIKRGARGRPVQLYGNAVVFKDRSLLDSNEYLDLASGPPIAARRGTVHSKRIHTLETIAQEDKTLLSGQHPKVLRLDFAASAKSHGLMSKDLRDGKLKKMKSTRRDREHPTTPTKGNGVSRVEPPSPTQMQTPVLKGSQQLKSGSMKSPALTGKRAELKMDPTTVADVTKLTPDELIIALEDHDARRSQSAVTHFSPEEEEQYVRRLISLRKELQNAISSGKFVHARTLTVPPGSSRQLVVVMTPNGSTRPHVTTRAKRSESRIYIKLLEYDQSLLSKAVGPHRDLSELPVRDLVIRSSCVRSVLEVQQSSINFGTCERGEVKSRTIVIHNKSDCPGVFRMRTSGSIASGNLKLGLGRYGVVSAFGRKEVASFSFIPSMVGNFQETIVVENVLDSFNDQNVLVKATVRKMPAFSLDVTKVDIAPSTAGAWPSAAGFVLTNTSKTERTFVIEAAETADAAFAELSLSRDEKDAGQALSKGEEEEVEAILQKLKIARRKNKPDKIAKYEKRLGELGVVTAPPEETPSPAPKTPDDVAVSGTVTPGEVASTPTITVTLQASKKAKILVNLVPRDGKEAFSSTIKVFERKNTDETVTIDVTASPEPEAVSPAPTPVPEDPLNLAIMRHCLELTLECPVSPTAFCVGSTLFLPASSPLFPTLRPLFPVFSHPVTGEAAGLVLADGYSRQIPGNTHAEANALANFRERMVELEEAEEERAKADDGPADAADVASPSPSPGALASSSAPLAAAEPPLPTPEAILAQAVCFATMEPCSVRTSGGPSCALELVRAHVHAVYLGVEEPPDFVQCEGVRILEQGGVEVRRVVGLEDECLRAARRGRS